MCRRTYPCYYADRSVAYWFTDSLVKSCVRVFSGPIAGTLAATIIFPHYRRSVASIRLDGNDLRARKIHFFASQVSLPEFRDYPPAPVVFFLISFNCVEIQHPRALNPSRNQHWHGSGQSRPDVGRPTVLFLFSTTVCLKK